MSWLHHFILLYRLGQAAAEDDTNDLNEANDNASHTHIHNLLLELVKQSIDTGDLVSMGSIASSRLVFTARARNLPVEVFSAVGTAAVQIALDVIPEFLHFSVVCIFLNGVGGSSPQGRFNL
uniref:Putative secreted protein n=1 Tax=Ixodes ricinus TaxID=34613 RepID=A0A6B0UNQ6_IXORI